MQIDKNKLNKIGIDRIIINNFKILNFENLEKKIVNTSTEYIEKLEKNHQLFHLSYSIVLKKDNQLYTIASLEFNPSKFLSGHNIYNSTTKEVKKTLDQIILILSGQGIEIDLSLAKIKEIEINVTIEQEFRELEEVLLLIGRANYQKALGMYSFNFENIPRKIKSERSLYINHKNQDYKEVYGKTIKIYDKTFELLRNQEFNVDLELTRVEILCGRDFYRNFMENLGRTNSLFDMLSNPELLEVIYKNSLLQELSVKPKKYLETLKKNLKYDFNNFRRNEILKRSEREKFKELGKDIPEIYKEERGVFEYLKKESWIFDYSYLYEIVIDEIEISNKAKFIKQIKKKYININNLELLKELLKKLNIEYFF
ncbi:MAG: phage/plasmid replication domain-containing protein [Fusobacteriaceae bacterium]